MNENLRFMLVIVLTILMGCSLILSVFAILKLKKRRKNHIFLNRFLLLYPFLFIFFLSCITYSGFISNWKHNLDDLLVVLLIILQFYIVVSLWGWTHYEIEIKDDKFIYWNFFRKKIIINFDEIDIKNSKYVFVSCNAKFDSYEYLEIKMINGQNHIMKFHFFQEGDDSLMFDIIVDKLKIEREGLIKRCFSLKKWAKQNILLLRKEKKKKAKLKKYKKKQKLSKKR